MRRVKHLLTLVLLIPIVIILTVLFIAFYTQIGGDLAEPGTLFHVLKGIDYYDLTWTFVLVTLYLTLIDIILTTVISRFRRLRNDEKTHLKDRLGKNGKKTEEVVNLAERLLHFWQKYRRLHLSFILLAFFLTIAISAPSSIMNTFTAIVSISVLVSNLMKKIG